jgi:pyruvate formate lyase activating enzyme
VSGAAAQGFAPAHDAGRGPQAAASLASPAASPPTAADLRIAGLAKLSTCDWPGRLAATVFLQGCPWRCGYCQNPGLIDPRLPGQMPWPEVAEFLSRRQGLLDGVVFSGGEPTRQAALLAALAEVRELGFGTGLHTAGAYPARLAAVLPLLDWVGLDLKALPEHYGAVTGVAAAGAKALESLDLVVASGVDMEVRITVDPVVHTGQEILDLVGLARRRGAKRVALQEARAKGASPEYGQALAGRRLRDVLEAPPGVTLRLAD